MPLRAVAMPGGARFVSGGQRKSVNGTLDGTLERTFEVGGWVLCAAVLPDGVHWWSAPAARGLAVPRRRDARPHFKGLAGSSRSVYAITVTRDGQHIISSG